MANMPDDKWVDDQLNTLSAPDGSSPNLAHAREELRDRTTKHARQRRAMWVVGATALVALAVLPWPRAAAQQIWQRLFASRVEVIQVESEGLPESLIASLLFVPGGTDVEFQPVSGLAEAERLAGFRPLLPGAGVLKGEPQLGVIQQLKLTTAPIRTADLERALASFSAWDVTVPKEWEGVTLTAEGGPVVSTRYDNAEVMQATSFRIVMPPGFEFARFMEVAFRVFGRGAEEARLLGAKFDANPALLLHFPESEPVRDIGFETGSGIFVGDPESRDGICFFWNTTDRLFIVSAESMSFETAAALADSINKRGTTTQ